MGERRPLSSAAFNSRVKRLTRPTCLKTRSPSKNQIKKSVSDLIACDLVGIAKTLKKSNISCLSLYQKYAGLQKRKAENRKLGFLGYRHSEALFTFSRALAWALSGSSQLQELELGFTLWERDLKLLAESLSQSTTLKRLSFANSELGDHSLQILGRSLQECAQLEILNLSACALTDAVAPLLSTILKAHVCRKSQADWQASLRSSKGVNALTMRPKGLVALDISLNQLSDITTQTVCTVLRIGTPLEALNLRGNQLTRLSGKLLLDVMEEWAVLRFADLRDNVDNRLMGVLEDGQHLTTFSRMQAPFWMSSPSTKLKRACYKATLKKSRGISAWEDAKPCNDVYKNYTQNRTSKPSVRPQSAPSILPVNHQPRGLHYKPPLIASESNKRHGDFKKNIPRLRALDVKSVKHLARRPSTSPEKFQLNAGKKQLPSSCSTSPEFAAWGHDDPNTKENRLPLQINRANATYQERSMSDEELPWKETIQTKGVIRLRREDATVLRPIDMTKSDRCGENVDSSNRQQGPRGVAKPGSRKPKQLKSQSESMPVLYSQTHAANEEPQSKSGLRKGARNLSPSGVEIQTTEWNSFLKEITHAIFHLQERLDELIGPADPDSVPEQATSQLQVLC